MILRELKVTEMISITDENFDSEVLTPPELTLVYFWADWCKTCPAMKKILERFADEGTGINIVSLDVEKNSKTALKYGVRNLPTIFFFKNGTVVTQEIGTIPLSKLKEIVSNIP